MAHAVEELLEMLYNMVQEAFALPFGSDRCILDKDKVLGLLDEINATLPKDLREARVIVESRNEVLGNARREAESIKRVAEERARSMVSEEEVLTIARKKAGDMMAAAEGKAREVRRATNEYVESALRRTEEALAQALSEVRQSRSDFRQTTARPSQTVPPPAEG